MRDLNEQIARALGGALFPLDDGGGRPRASDLGELVAAVTPMPALKLATAHTVCAHAAARVSEVQQLRRLDLAGAVMIVRTARRHMPVGGWDALGLQLGERFPRFYAGSDRAVTLSALAIARGAESTELGAPAAKLERLLGGSPLSPFNVEWRYAPSQSGGCGVEQSLSVIANRTSVEAVLSQTLQRADAQLDAGAYVHHYARYGCTEPVLREYIDECWGIVAEYRQAQGATARSAPPAPLRGASSVRGS
ncbi:hypothetical protein T492DRAFT_1039505 [Pavlovales sp. CCMP2436]|nr:hypothetical protein T492DRAFT_1039505 [Pavlovales sp. CCMP2436]